MLNKINIFFEANLITEKLLNSINELENFVKKIMFKKSRLSIKM